MDWNVKATIFNMYRNDMAAFDQIKLFCLIKLTLLCRVSSSPNSPLLFATAFWGETNRSSLSQMFLKMLHIITAKHQWWSFFIIKLQARKRLQHSCFPVKFVKLLRTAPVAASEQTQEISVVHCLAMGFFGHLAHI